MLNGRWSGTWLSERNRSNKEIFIPLWTPACFPRHTADIAKFMTAAAAHVKTTLGQLDHVPAFATLLPLCPLRCIHEKLYMWVTRTQSVVCAVFALHTGHFIAVDAGAYIGANIFDSDEGGAIEVGAVRGVRCSKLLYFEIKSFDISLRKHGTTDLKRYWILAAFGGKYCNVVESHGEMIEEAASAIAMSHGLTLKRQSVYGRYLVETRLAQDEGLFRVWF